MQNGLCPSVTHIFQSLQPVLLHHRKPLMHGDWSVITRPLSHTHKKLDSATDLQNTCITHVMGICKWLESTVAQKNVPECCGAAPDSRIKKEGFGSRLSKGRDRANLGAQQQGLTQAPVRAWPLDIICGNHFFFLFSQHPAQDSQSQKRIQLTSLGPHAPPGPGWDSSTLWSTGLLRLYTVGWGGGGGSSSERKLKCCYPPPHQGDWGLGGQKEQMIATLCTTEHTRQPSAGKAAACSCSTEGRNTPPIGFTSHHHNLPSKAPSFTLVWHPNKRWRPYFEKVLGGELFICPGWEGWAHGSLPSNSSQHPPIVRALRPVPQEALLSSPPHHPRGTKHGLSTQPTPTPTPSPHTLDSHFHTWIKLNETTPRNESLEPINPKTPLWKQPMEMHRNEHGLQRGESKCWSKWEWGLAGLKLLICQDVKHDLRGILSAEVTIYPGRCSWH